MSYPSCLVVAAALLIAGCGAQNGARTSASPAPQRLPASGPVSAVAPPPPWAPQPPSARDCAGGATSTAVDRDPNSLTEIQQDWPPAPFSTGFSPILRVPWGQNRARFLIADRGRGVRMLRNTGLESHGGFYSSGRSIAGAPLDLATVGDYALLFVTREGGGHELMLFKPSHVFDTLSRLPQSGELRGAHVLHASQDGGTVAVIVDLYEGEGCERRRTQLRVLEVGERGIAERQVLELGAGVQRVLRSGAWLAVHDAAGGDGAQSHGVRLVDLTRGELTLSARRTTMSVVHAFYARQARKLLLVHGERDAAQLEILHAAASGTLSTARPCKLEVPPLDGAVPLESSTLLVLAAGEVGKRTVRVVDDRSCSARELMLLGERFMLAPTGDALVGLSVREGPALDVYAYQLAQLDREPAHARVELAKPAPGDNDAFNRFWVESARFHQLDARHITHWRKVVTRETIPARHLLAVPFQEHGAGGRLELGTQVFELDGPSLRHASRYEGQLWFTHSNHAGVLSNRTGVRLANLLEPEAFKTKRHRPWQHTIDAELLEPVYGLARLLYPSASSQYDPHTGALFASLEIVAADLEEPVLFDVSGNARLDTVGSLLIASSQEIAHSERKRPRPCRFEIFDATPKKVRKLATHLDTVLCDEAHALTDQPAFSTPRALVFARTENDQLAFHALDLRQPATPVMRGPFPTPEGEHALGSFGDGTRITYGFRVRVVSANAQPPVARYYVRSVDFSDPTAPRFGEPVAVRGEPIAMVGKTLYTREAQWRGQAAEYTVHELRVHAGKVETRASGLDEHAVRALDRPPEMEPDAVIADRLGYKWVQIRHGVESGLTGPP